MALAYGNYIQVASGSRKWRAILSYYGQYIDGDYDSYRVVCKIGYQFVNTNYSGEAARKMTIGSESQSYSSGTSWSIPLDGTKYFFERTITYDRYKSDREVTINFSSYIGGSHCPGTSSGSVTITIPHVPTYNISFNRNGGSGTISDKTKYYGYALTLPSSGFTRTNYKLKGWSTSSSATIPTYRLGGSYTANASDTLYAVWEPTVIPPTITNFKAERYKNNLPDDEGQQGHIYMNYTSSTLAGVKQSMNCSIKVGSTTVYNEPLNVNGGTLDVIVQGTYSENTSYGVTVTITYSNKTITKTASLPAADFPIDVLANGSAVGIKTAAKSGQKVTVPELYIGNTRLSSKDTSGSSAQFVVEYYESPSVSVSGNSSGSISHRIEKANYRAVGIVGSYVSSSYVFIRGAYLSTVDYSSSGVGSATIQYYVRNTSSSSQSITATTRVLWVKAL